MRKKAEGGRKEAEAGAEAQTAQRAAYAELARAQEGFLLGAARRMCGREADSAQDLVQEALVRGYEAFIAGRFVEGTHARAWLLRILTNLFINDFRRDQKWNAGINVETLTAHGEIAPEALRTGDGERPEAALLEGTLEEPVEQALQSLSEGLRLCVLLVDIEGMDYASAADVLGIPVGTVRSRLSRARSTLHTLLYDYAHARRRV